MTKKELKKILDRNVKSKPANWRYGQWVFNYIDLNYKVARTVQLKRKIDCFYDDTQVDDFIDACAIEITNLNTNK